MNRKLLITTAAGTAIVLLAGWGTQDSNIAGDKKHSINFYGTLETWASPGDPMEVENISIENIFKQIPMYVKPSHTPEKQKEVTAQNAIAQAARSAEQAAKAAKKAAQTAKKVSKKGIDEGATAATDAAKAAQAAAQAATAAAEAIATTVPQSKKTKTRKHSLPEDPKTSLIQAEVDLAEVGEIKTPYPDEIWTYQKKEKDRKFEFVQVTIISNDAKKTKTDYLVERWKKVYCDRTSAAGPGEQKVPLTAIKSLKINGYKDREQEERKKRQEQEKEKIKRIAKKRKS